MIRLNVFIKIKPEEREEIIATANALVEKSLQEKGCIAYGCFANTTDPTVFLICETWADENALAAHKQTPHYIELAGKLHRMTEMKAEKFTF